MPDLSLPQLPARYTVDALLGQGAFGRVYRAVDRLNGSTVAVKVLQMRDDFPRSALVHEFQFLTTLKHPNVVGVRAFGFTADGEPYFTMDYLDARPVTIALARSSQAEQIEAVVQLLRGLAYVHARGVLHRDIKPDNVLTDASGQTRLLDFGLASLTSHTSDGESITGTPRFMAPELFSGDDPTPQSDLYGAGCILYTLLMGMPPFAEHKNIGDVIDAKFSWKPKTAHRLQPILAALLALDPVERYASANEAIAHLNQCLDEPYPIETLTTRHSFVRQVPLVGRMVEREHLAQAQTEAQAGHGRLILLGGESGAGKSRLVNEAAINAQVNGWDVITGHAAAAGGAPLLPLRPVVRELSLRIALPPERLAPLLAAAPDLPQLLNQPIEPAPPLPAKAHADRFTGALLDLLRATQSPLLLVFEDLHWADAQTQAFLQTLSGVINGLPILAVGTYRSDEAPDLPRQLPLAASILLPSFTADDLAPLLTAALGHDAPSELVAHVANSTGGNPFFALEAVWAQADRSGSLESVRTIEVDLSGGVLALIQSRVARLDNDSRSVMETASLIGRRVDGELLAGLSGGTSISSVMEAAALQQLVVWDGEGWSFYHDQVRDALREGMGENQRRDRHSDIALTMETLYAARRDELTPALAYHWEEAGQFPRAVPYLAAAAKKANARSAYHDALGFASRGLAALEQIHGGLEAERMMLLRERSTAYRMLGDRAAQQADVDTWLARERSAGAVLAAAYLNYDLSQYEASRVLVEEALALVGDDTLTAGRAWHLLGGVNRYTSRFTEALEAFTRSRELCEAAGNLAETATAWSGLAGVYYELSNYAAVRQADAESLRLARQMGNVSIEAEVLNSMGILQFMDGDYDGHERYHTQALDLLTRMGDRSGEANMLSNLSAGAIARREFGVAVDRARRSADIYEALNDTNGRARALGNLGFALSVAGDLDASLVAQRESLRLRQEVGDRRGAAIALDNIGKVLLDMGDLTGARAAAQESIDIFHEVGDKYAEALALMSLGLASEGEPAIDAHRRSDELFDEVGTPLAAITNTARLAALLTSDQAKAVLETALDKLKKNNDRNGPDEDLLRLYDALLTAMRAHDDLRYAEFLARAKAALDADLALMDEAARGMYLRLPFNSRILLA